MKRIAHLLSAVAETLHRFFLNSNALYRTLEAFNGRMGFVLYAAHTGPAGFSDTTYSISASLPATYDATGYGTTTGIAWTLIGSVESFPEIGEDRPTAEFRPISGAVTTVKGASRYGGGDMVMADIPADAGQVICKAAVASENHYSMKITYPDGEIHYLDVMLTSWKLVQQAEGAFMKRTCGVMVQRDPVVVAAS